MPDQPQLEIWAVGGSFQNGITFELKCLNYAIKSANITSWCDDPNEVRKVANSISVNLNTGTNGITQLGTYKPNFAIDATFGVCERPSYCNGPIKIPCELVISYSIPNQQGVVLPPKNYKQAKCKGKSLKEYLEELLSNIDESQLSPKDKLEIIKELSTILLSEE